MYWFDHDLSEERVLRAKAAADEALRLDPDLAEAHAALGWYYYHGRLDYERALEAFGIARKAEPGNAEILLAIGAIQRRQGSFQEAASTLVRAADLDPRSSILALEVAVTYLVLGQYPQAERYFDRAISLQPDWIGPYIDKARMYLISDGDVQMANQVLEDASEMIDPALVLARLMFNWNLFAVLGPDYADRLRRLRLDMPGTDTATYFLRKARIYRDQPDRERAYFDSARVFLENRVRQHPEDPTSRTLLGIAHAGLGRREEAVREGKKAVELWPIANDALDGPDYVIGLAEIYTMVGDSDAAIAQLEQVLAVPSQYSVNWLRLAHTWDPLRDHPRFQALLVKYEKAAR